MDSLRLIRLPNDKMYVLFCNIFIRAKSTSTGSKPMLKSVEQRRAAIRPGFNRSIEIDFLGARITWDGPSRVLKTRKEEIGELFPMNGGRRIS